MQALKNYFLCTHRMNRMPFFLIAIMVAVASSIINLHFVSGTSLKYQHAAIVLDQQKAHGKMTQEKFNASVHALGLKMQSDLPQDSLLVVGLITCLLLLPATIMRLKDLDYPLWLAAFSFAMVIFAYIHVPLFVIEVMNVAGIVLELLLFFKRGTKGPNRYGPDPLAVAVTG